MKKAISLIEVLISVMLISIVIVSMLQIKENNLNFLQKSKDMIKYNAFISMIAQERNNDGKIYLEDKINFRDDEIRKKLKKIKIEVTNKTLDPLNIGTDEYSLFVNIEQTHLKINDKIKKTFYRFRLEQ